MAKNASVLLLVPLFMFGLLSCAIKGRHPLQLTDDNGSSSNNDGSSSYDDGSSSYDDGSSSENGDSSVGTRINVGPCYDACPSGTCEDNDNCYCSNEYDPNAPFCRPKITELGPDYSSSDDEHEDTSTSDSYSSDEESSSNDGGSQSGDV